MSDELILFEKQVGQCDRRGARKEKDEWESEEATPAVQ
jgi:hypothetical protein